MTAPKNQPLNAFTKSYPLRYVVHAYRVADKERTLCGRDIHQTSTVKFDLEAEGSCKKCLNILEIEGRVHPGWES